MTKERAKIAVRLVLTSKYAEIEYLATHFKNCGNLEN